MENVWMPPGYPLLKKPLAECCRVFNNPVKIPQWILLQIIELKEFSSSCVCLHTYSMPTWKSILSFHLLKAHLEELFESSVILVLLRTHSRVLLLCTPCTGSIATWQSFTESSVILSATVSLLHNLASKVFNNLEVFLLSC
jgi:hypothetical protein